MEASVHLKGVDPSAPDPESNWRILNEDLNTLNEVIARLERRVAALELEVEQLEPVEDVGPTAD
jgi:uncharacterized small protein (DUF1192 family)